MLDRDNETRMDVLKGFPSDGMVLSVYLPLDPGTLPQHGYETALINTLRDSREATPLNLRDSFDLEAERILRLVSDGFEPRGRTLAIFSSPARDDLEVLSLRAAMPSLARFQQRPYLAPLEAALEDDPRIGIAVVDQREAKLMTTFMSEIDSIKTVKDPVPGRQRQGGWSAFRYERDRARHVEQHLKHVANLLAGLHRHNRLGRLVIGGTAETVSALERALTPELQAILAGSFAAEMFAPEPEILQQALPIAERKERADEVQLVETIREAALDGRRAALGWDETLYVLAQGRVQCLALGERNIGTPQGDQALILGWDSDARVEFLHGEAEALLADNGGVGALLRY